MTSTDDTPAVPSRRPDVRHYSVAEIVEGVLSGQIRIPIVPGGLKWGVRDALELLDSIDRGYPIGTVVLWQRPARDGRSVHGSVVVDAPARRDALRVIDGQQRLVALTRIFAGEGHPNESFAAFYDLDGRVFKHIEARAKPGENDLPLTAIMDPAALDGWLAGRDGADREVALRLADRLREYRVVAHVVDTEDERVVRDIVRRLNRTDRSLADDEVFQVLYGEGGSRPVSVRDVGRSLGDLAFGRFDDELVLSLLRAVRVDETDERLSELEPAEVHHALLDLENCLRAVITFLRRDAGIPHISLLPDGAVLPVLARFFDRHPEPHPRSRELLSRWLWRRAVSGRDGDARSARELLAAVDADEHRTVQRLLRTAPVGRSVVLDMSDRSLASASSRVLFLALLDLQPRDLRTGDRVGPNEDELARTDAYRHLLNSVAPTGAGEDRGFAQWIVHPVVDVGLVRAIVACEDVEVLASHAISPDARRALESGDVDEFVRRRGLWSVLVAFIERRAEWGEPDTPPVDVLYLRGD